MEVLEVVLNHTIHGSHRMAAKTGLAKYIAACVAY